jgi:hypothetical protein
MSERSEPLQSNEVDIQTQLNIALELLTKEQYDAWGLQMELLKKEGELLDDRKRISNLEERVTELTGVSE